MKIVTARLDLVPATAIQLRAALAGREPLAHALGASVPATWPPDFLDDAALEFTLARCEEDPALACWWMYFALIRGPGARALVGSVGFKGPPSMDGTVEVGYGIVSDQRRRGFATEATLGLVAHAIAHPGVRRVIAETLPALTASIGVLRKCGFHPAEAGSEPGVLRFELIPQAPSR